MPHMVECEEEIPLRAQYRISPKIRNSMLQNQAAQFFIGCQKINEELEIYSAGMPLTCMKCQFFTIKSFSI